MLGSQPQKRSGAARCALPATSPVNLYGAQNGTELVSAGRTVSESLGSS